MIKLLKRLWNWLNEPSLYELWNEAFEKLQAEKKQNGMSSEYWRIWYEEVCPAYRNLTGGTPRPLRHINTDKILDDMDKPVAQREYF